MVDFRKPDPPYHEEPSEEALHEDAKGQADAYYPNEGDDGVYEARVDVTAYEADSDDILARLESRLSIHENPEFSIDGDVVIFRTDDAGDFLHVQTLIGEEIVGL